MMIDDRLQRAGLLPEEMALLKLACAKAFMQFPACGARARMAVIDELIGLLDELPEATFSDMLLKAKITLLQHGDIAAPPALTPRLRRANVLHQARGAPTTLFPSSSGDEVSRPGLRSRQTSSSPPGKSADRAPKRGTGGARAG